MTGVCAPLCRTFASRWRHMVTVREDLCRRNKGDLVENPTEVLNMPTVVRNRNPNTGLAKEGRHE